VPFLFEAGLLEASTHPLAKFLHRLGDPGKFHVFAGTGFQLPQLGGEAFQALLQFWPSPLVFFQGNHARQIRLCQAFHLVLDTDARLAQILPSGLQFLGEPLSPLCPKPCQGQTLRVQQHLAQIRPDQIVQLSNREISARGTSPCEAIAAEVACHYRLSQRGPYRSCVQYMPGDTTHN
jgi:hypothetical protein